ncbi:hypothetical protein MKW92_047382 [Papaver armeniacum]|nr:hypothetical protein MKW92_047382 [Papaver armeniacum]
MDSVLIFSIFFFFFLNTFAMDDECSISKCGDDHVTVKFPFRITQNQHTNCGYPGFDLSCTSFGKTVIQLPSSTGEFFVSAIDYVKQEIHIHDPDDCLPKRLLSFDLSTSPFQGIQFQDYSFLNCTSNYTTSKISPISCLSSSMNKVFVTNSLSLAGILPTDCKIIDKIMVPIIPRQPENEKGFSSELDNDLILSWKEPNCSKCDEFGRGCKNLTSDGDGIGCTTVLQIGSPTSMPSISNEGKQSFKLTLGIILPAFILTVIFVCYMSFKLNLCQCDRNRTENLPRHNDRQARRHQGERPTILIVTTVGLDGTTIESYPMATLGESRRIPTPNDGTCSICLSEYRPKDIVRTIPDCKHCFHAECIDEWLRMNASCPLCRTSPSPFASPITQPGQIYT